MTLAIDLVTVEAGHRLYVRASFGRHRLADARVKPLPCPCCTLPIGYVVRLKARTAHARLLRRAVRALVGELSDQFNVIAWEAETEPIQDTLRECGFRAVARAGAAVAFGRE